MKIVKGKPASPGIVIANVFKLENVQFNINKKSIKDANKEIIVLEKAKAKTIKDLEKLVEKTKSKLGEEKAAIFEAHIQIVNDPEFFKEVEHLILEKKVNSAYALTEITNKYYDLFSTMDNDYMKERASDIKDVCQRIISYILGVEILNLDNLKSESIIFCEDLTPSQTANLNKNAKGFVTEIGGITSHSAIMANSLEIPAIVGTGPILKKLKNNQQVIINGSTGEVIIDPSKKQLEEYSQLISIQDKEKKQLLKLVTKKSITLDNHKIKIEANIGNIKDALCALENGAEGIGLFRSEFLYMHVEDWPSEEIQFQAYKEVLQKFKNKSVVIRTLDIGGDKTLPYFKFPHETNPFLGYRAIRLCLKKRDVFKTQLRSLLRASAFGRLKIMFPFIATIEEFKSAKRILDNVAKELQTKKIKIGNYQVGMMMEIPVATMLCDKFAKISDFFSIGTNDLLQYSFAADRMNEKVNHLYQPLNPGNLRIIKKIIDEAHKAKKWVGMCGAMAGNELAIPLLIGMGLDDFSMSPTMILKARKITRQLYFKKCQQLVYKALDCETEKEVTQLVKTFLKKS